MDAKIRTRNQLCGKAKRTLIRLNDCVAMKLPAEAVRTEIDILDSQVAKIRELHYDYVDRLEMDLQIEPSDRDAELVKMETWLKEWSKEYLDKVKLAVEYCSSIDVSLNSQISNLSVSQPQVSKTDGATSSSGIDHKLLQILSLNAGAQRPPSVQVPVFGGNPKNYTFFITTFEELVAKHFDSPRTKLAQLFCHVEGEALAAIHHAMSYPEDKCYERALEVLSTRFGDKTEIARVALDDLISGPACVTSSDLCSFVEELGNTKRMVGATVYANALDSHEAIDKLLVRLPVNVHDRWAKYARKHKRTKKAYPGISEFQQFIAELAEEFGDHMYGIDSTKRRALLAKSRAAGDTRASLTPPLLVGASREKTKTIPKSFTALQNNEPARGLIMPSNLHSAVSSTCVSDYESDSELGAVSMLSSQNSQKTQHRENAAARYKKYRAKNCPYCDQTVHDLVSCTVFSNAPHADRWDQTRLRLVQVCYKCLKLSCDRKCTFKKSKCCALPYHILLHPDHCRQVVDNMMHTIASRFILPIVEVYVHNKKIFVYLDTCSTHSFATEKLLNLANLKSKDEVFYSSGSIHGSQNQSSKIVDFSIRPPMSHVKYEIHNAFIVSRLPMGRRAVQCDVEDNPHLRGLPLAEASGDVEILALIGQDHSHLLTPLEVRKHPEFPSQAVRGRPYAVRTLLGWAISGKGADISNEKKVALLSSQTEIEQDIRHLWDVERELDDVTEKSIIDRKVEENWLATYKIDDDNHYEVSIPLRDPKKTFPDNRDYALRRLKMIIRNLKHKNAFEAYKTQIFSMITDGYAEKVPIEELHRTDGFLYFLPHFPVYHPEKPGKVRVVNDCKAEFDGVSINNMCLSGPDLLNKLINVLLRFRLHEHAWAADVSAMYFQVRIPKDQRDLLRFFWVDEHENVIEYRMVGHVMGGIWSSASSTFAIRQAAKNNASHPKIINVIENSLYVDDALHSEEKKVDAELTAYGCYNDLKINHFNFCKFVSTHPDILRRVPETLYGEAIKVIEGDPESKALGLRWNIKHDFFYYVRDKLTDFPDMTKRKLLSQVATLYDPLGLIQPIILIGKLIFQRVTRARIGWDDLLPPSELNAWKRWFVGLKDIHTLHFPRCLVGTLYTGARKELHTFCDASELAYGTVTYLRAIPADGKIKVILIMGKGRVAPNKSLTVPRLELCAALTGIKQENVVRKQTGLELDSRYFWTDSIIVLHYLKNPALRLKSFVSRRVDTILDFSTPEQWHHVRTNVNPADIVSRGVHVAAELPALWMEGPAFLRQPENSWPEEVTTLPVPSAPLEVKSMLLAAQSGRMRVFARLPEQRWDKAEVPETPDGREYLLTGSRQHAMLFQPEVPRDHRVPPLKAPCYSGEHSCLIAVTAPRGQPMSLFDAFCFTCEKNDMAPTDSLLVVTPEVPYPEANMVSMVMKTRSQTAREGKIGKNFAGKHHEENSTPSESKIIVERYLTVPWPLKPHLVYADPIGSMIRYYGDIRRLCKSYAWWRRLCKRARGEATTGPLSLEEIDQAELLLVKHVQHEVYAREIRALKERRRIPVSSDLLPLNPRLAGDMLIVQGRLRSLASVDLNVQPYILPKKHHLSVLLCRRIHYSSHVGSEWALTILRKKYWIISARSILRDIRRTCVTCQRFHKAPEQQKMADLPPERLVAGPVCFLNTGVDLFGPFLVTVGRKSAKRWGVIFTCMSARAVHLEVVHSMDTDSFIMALMRFICRRGIPLKMLSDRGTNIIGAESEMNAAWCEADTDAITLEARSKGIAWKFNPPKASNMGGVWERQIRTIRSCLNPILKTQSSLDDETLYTSLVEVENLINSRPLTKVSADPEDGVLTPNHLLILQDNSKYTAQELDLGAVYRRKWKRVMQIRDQFWKKWTSGYLQDLQVRRKWQHDSPDLKKDDIVLQVETGQPRGVWPLAVVTSTAVSHDGRVRSVDIKTQKSNYTRPVNKLVKLELD